MGQNSWLYLSGIARLIWYLGEVNYGSINVLSSIKTFKESRVNRLAW